MTFYVVLDAQFGAYLFVILLGAVAPSASTMASFLLYRFNAE